MNVQPYRDQSVHRPPLLGGLQLAFAESAADVRAAQHLRYAIFAGEMGARLHNRIPGLDHDAFDAHCHHLLVREALTGQVVGCTRILTEEGARQAGGFYSQGEFDLGPILALPGRFAEIGRTCVQRDYRNGATISALWTGIASLVAAQGIDYLIGCASIPLGQDGMQAQAIYAGLAERYLSEPQLRVRPKIPLPRRDGIARADSALPPLLKAYLRVGARICGEPCLDEDFRVADVFILLATGQLERRYARHFLDRAA